MRAAHLDQPGQEERFNRYARLAQAILGVPTAFVSIITQHEQLFKGGAGSDLCSTDRSVAFCAHAIETPESIMEIPDATQDARFADNPLVTGDMGIRYYAGAPIVVGGHAYGTICALDTVPRAPMSAEHRALFADLAAALSQDLSGSQDRHDLTVIARELRHRMGNVYALISSLVTLLARTSATKEELANRLRERIVSLGETQKLLIGDERGAGTITRLAEHVLSPLRVAKGPRRIHIQETDDFAVAPRAAFLLTLMLGELVTNSAKHGALAIEGGTVHFTWHAKDDDRSKLILQWAEDCGDNHYCNETVADFDNRRRGFGSQILLKILPADVRGEADIIMTARGLTYRLTGMASRLVDSHDEDEMADDGPEHLEDDVQLS